MSLKQLTARLKDVEIERHVPCPEGSGMDGKCYSNTQLLSAVQGRRLNRPRGLGSQLLLDGRNFKMYGIERS